MSITASNLIAMVQVGGVKEATAQFVEMGVATESVGTKLKALAVGGIALAAGAAIGFGAESVKMAGDFQQSVNMLATSAGETKANLGMVSDGLLKMSVTTGTGTKMLADGMYTVESAGYHGAEGLKVLQAAAMGAKAENANLADVANAVTSALNAYHLGAGAATWVTNDLVAAVGAGKMHMQDLAVALKNVLPVSAVFKISLQDTTAAISTMTMQGDDAASAATHLRQMIIALEAPAKAGAKSLAEIGLSSQQVSDEMRVSLPGAIQMITDALGKKFPVGSEAYNQALKNISGGSKQMLAMLELSGSHLQTFKDNVDQVSNAVKKGGDSIYGWDIVQGNFNFKMDQAKNAVEALMIKVGTALIPVVSKVLDMVTPLISGFSDWIGKSNILTGTIDEVSKAFQSVFEPVQQVQKAVAPLLDTFDRATALIPRTTAAAKPLLDTFDRATAILHQTYHEATPLLDTFDRATALLPKTTDAVKKTNAAVDPLVTLFKQWKPVLEDVAKTLGILAGDVGTFAGGIVGAAGQSGAFQSVFQAIHDLLPNVDALLVQVGTDVNSYLLPPLESLTTNVGQVVSDFVSWVNTSGTAKSAIADLGTAVGITAQVVGTLVQGLADIIKWFDQDAPQAYILAGAVTAVGLAFVGLKVANTVAGLVQLFNTWNAGTGIVANFASAIKDKAATAIDTFTTKQFPNLKNSLNGITGAADAAAEAEVKVATAATEKSSATWFADLESSLGDVENKANAAATAEETVGTTAETKMATGVETGAATSAAALDSVKVSADEAAAAEGTVGTAATTKMAGGVEAGAVASKGAMSSLGGIIGGLIPLLAIMGSEWAYNAVSGQSFFDQVSRHDWLGALQTFVAMGTPAGQLAKTLDFFKQFPDQFSKFTAQITGSSQDMNKNVSSNASDMSKNVIANLTDMKNKGLEQTSQLTWQAQDMFAQMGNQVGIDMSNMDASTKGYWNDVANYINNHPLNVPLHNQGAHQAFASGTDNAPGGPALVGEAGAELVLGPRYGDLPQGSRVIPHAQTMAMLGSGGGGNNQPIHVHVHIADQEFQYLTNAMMQSAMSQANLQFGRKVF